MVKLYLLFLHTDDLLHQVLEVDELGQTEVNEVVVVVLVEMVDRFLFTVER